MAEQTTYSDQYGYGSYRNGTDQPYYSAAGEAESQEISLHEVLEIFSRNRWLILACFVLVVAGAALYTFRQDPEYEATSTVFVNTQQSNPQLGELLGLETANRNVANEIEIVKSRTVAMHVAEKLMDIERIPGTDRLITVLASGEDAPPPGQLDVARRLQSRLRVDPVNRGVDIIEIRATSTIPEEAALIATLYAEAYVEYNRTTSRSRMTASREFLKDITDKYRQELQLTEDNLTAFLNQESVVALDEEARQLIQQVSDLQQQQYETRLKLGMAQAEIRSLEAQIEQIRPGLASQLSSGDNLVIDQLVQEIARLEVAIERKYAHNPGLRDDPSQDPELVRNLEVMQSLREELNQRSEHLVQGVLPDGGSSSRTGEGGLGLLAGLQRQIMEKRIEASALEASLELIDQQLSQAKAELSDIPRKEIILRGLERSHQTTEQLYVSLIEKLQEARIAEQSELGYVDIVDKAIVPEEPVRPRVQLNLALGAVLGLLLGVGLAFARNAMDNKVRRPEDLSKHGFEVVGIVPNMERVIRRDFKGKEHVSVDGHEYSTRMVALLNPLSPVAEAYRRLRTNIQYSRPDGGVRTLVVTSPNPSEGKTVSALNLAVTMAQAGRRTLYIDADLRRPQGHRMMGIKREPGLADLLFEEVPRSMERFVSAFDSYLYVVPAGRAVPNPAEVLGSHKMKQWLARWKEEFDVVIIDTPPTLLVADAMILGSQVDASLVVCSAGETMWQAVEGSVASLRNVGAQVIGVLLNRFDPKDAYGSYKYAYRYGYGYYGYYGPQTNGVQGKSTVSIRR